MPLLPNSHRSLTRSVMPVRRKGTPPPQTSCVRRIELVLLELLKADVQRVPVNRAHNRAFAVGESNSLRPVWRTAPVVVGNPIDRRAVWRRPWIIFVWFPHEIAKRVPDLRDFASIRHSIESTYGSVLNVAGELVGTRIVAFSLFFGTNVGTRVGCVLKPEPGFIGRSHVIYVRRLRWIGN